jgi:hypothetical protein
MFRFDNIGHYKGLRALVSIKESIPPTTIVGGFIVAPIDLVVDHAFDEEEDVKTNNTLEDSNTSCDSDG